MGWWGQSNLVPRELSWRQPAPGTLVPEASVLLFFLGKFCDANRFFYVFFIGTKCWEPIKESLWSRPLGSSLLCHQLLTVASDWRIFLIALRVLWLDGFNIFGDAIRQKKMTSLTGVNCWASMKVRFSTILTRGFLSLGSALQLANLVPRAFSLAWGRGGTLKERSVYRTQTSYEQS